MSSKQLKQITLKKAAYTNLLRTIIESASKEATGFLFGSKRESNCTFVNAYPIITADRQPTSVSYGNEQAILRVRRLHNLMNQLGSLEGNWVGGYHSHPKREGDANYSLTSLSNEDIDFIRLEMKEHNTNSWVELVVRFFEKKFVTPHSLGQEVKLYKNKMEVIVTDTPFHQYKLCISAYIIKPKKEIKLKDKVLFKSKKKNKFNRRDFIVKELKVRYKS